MSVRRAQREFDSAEFSEWIAIRAERLGLIEKPEPVRTDDDLMAIALAWQARVNARPN